ncbi:hypothetical protein GGR56DRAFT_677952 [Xylariaceae sp. FL0804]|nr:hypothetical protein GGR56DRAFT_677952 [Xylariaceae sp. FL0804]
MAVTLMVWLTCAADTLTDGTRDAMAAALAGQAAWAAEHHMSLSPGDDDDNNDDNARGVALLRQVEDPRVVLETSAWPSAAQHARWLASEPYARGAAAVAPHFDMARLRFCYLDAGIFSGTAAAAAAAAVGSGSGPGLGSDGREREKDKEDEEVEKEEEGGPLLLPLLASPVVSVDSMTVAAARRRDFERDWDRVRGALEDYARPSAVRAAWRVATTGSKTDDADADADTDEFLFFCGWPSVERHHEFASSEGFQDFSSALLPYVLSREVRHYRRVL